MVLFWHLSMQSRDHGETEHQLMLVKMKINLDALFVSYFNIITLLHSMASEVIALFHLHFRVDYVFIIQGKSSTYKITKQLEEMLKSPDCGMVCLLFIVFKNFWFNALK
jgi:hypothetical protein